MSRAAEFCYIAETRDHKFIQCMLPMVKGNPMIFTDNPEMAIRFTYDGFHALRKAAGGVILGARKVLA